MTNHISSGGNRDIPVFIGYTHCLWRFALLDPAVFFQLA